MSQTGMVDFDHLGFHQAHLAFEAMFDLGAQFLDVFSTGGMEQYIHATLQSSKGIQGLVDFDPKRKSKTNTQHRLDAEVAASELLSDLIDRDLCTMSASNSQ